MCALCREIGDQVVWGNGVEGYPPSGVYKLEETSEQSRKCPRCGSRFTYHVEYEHASDHFMPDKTETLTRVKSPCDLCRELGDEASWGNASFAQHNFAPPAVERLAKLDKDIRECPGCGAWFEYSCDTEHASDSFRPDICEKLKRVR